MYEESSFKVNAFNPNKYLFNPNQIISTFNNSYPKLENGTILSFDSTTQTWKVSNPNPVTKSKVSKGKKK